MEFSRFIPYWQAKRNCQIHQKKLKQIQPVLNTTNNIGFLKQRNRSHEHQSFNYRKFQIQLQNKALLQKITHKSKPNTNQTQNKIPNKQNQIQKTSLKKSATNNHNHKHNHRHNNFQAYQIQHQNRNLLKLIQSTKTNYSAKFYINDYKQKQKYMNLICKYPLKGKKPTRTFLKLGLDLDLGLEGKKSEQRKQHQIRQSCINVNMNKTSIGQPKIKLPQNNHLKNKQKQKQKSYTQRTLTQRIRKIHRSHKIFLQNDGQKQSILVKGIQYTNYILLQIVMEKYVQQIKISAKQFLGNYQSEYQKLLNDIRFDGQGRFFYLESFVQ